MLKLCYLFILVLLINIPETISAETQFKLEKPVHYSGDKQQGKTGKILEKPIRVRVLDNSGKPAGNIQLVLEPLSSPSGASQLIINPVSVLTDSAGMASANIRLGDAKGEYSMLVRIKDSADSSYLIYRFTALASNWVMLMVFGLLGGLGLFLLGMNMMSQGMMKSAGDKMRSILGSLTRNRIIALGLGTFVTMVIQSSSATTVMLISFVNSGLMKFGQTLGIILGADIGTTITAQLIAFKLTDYSLLMIALGFAIHTFPKREKVRYVGEAIMGFGILFFGMFIMSESMYPLRTYEPFIDFIVHLEYPLAGILAGALFTALIQSSSAFIGIMIVLGAQGLLSLEASVPLLLGANIGTAVTALLASLNTNREAKKVALAHTLFKITGVLLIVWWIPDFIKLVRMISPTGEDINQMDAIAKELPRQIANAHTIFNVLITTVTLPFLNIFARLIEKVFPDIPQKKNIPEIQYLKDDPNVPPSLALSLAKQEVCRMANIVTEMVTSFIEPFVSKHKPDIKWMKEKEDEVDFLRDNITSYILKTATGSSKKERIHEAFEMLYTIKEFEQIADIVTSCYLGKAQKWFESDFEFSDEGKTELTVYHLQVLKQISRAVETFKEYNLEKARLMKEKHNKYRQVVINMQRNHYNRLADMMESSLRTSKTHLELMTLLATIYSHATNVARIILQDQEENISNDGEN